MRFKRPLFFYFPTPRCLTRKKTQATPLTFNLIHKCYKYIISSNKELLRCKKNTLYMYS
jgi:hypothetical protein